MGPRRALLYSRLRRLFQALDYHRSCSPRLAGHLACVIARSPCLDESVPLVPGDELLGRTRCRTARQKKIGLERPGDQLDGHCVFVAERYEHPQRSASVAVDLVPLVDSNRGEFDEKDRWEPLQARELRPVDRTDSTARQTPQQFPLLKTSARTYWLFLVLYEFGAWRRIQISWRIHRPMASWPSRACDLPERTRDGRSARLEARSRWAF